MNKMYARLSATSLRMLKQYGRPVILRSRNPGTYDPKQGKANDSSFEDEIRNGVFVDAPQKRLGLQYGQATEANSLVERSIKWIYLDANGKEPDIGDLIIADNTEYGITNVLAYNPAGKAVMYLVVARV